MAMNEQWGTADRADLPITLPERKAACFIAPLHHIAEGHLPSPAQREALAVAQREGPPNGKVRLFPWL